MELYEVFDKRYSCRNYDELKKVSKEKLERIFKQTRKAPSGMNKQPWEFVVIQDDENLKKVKSIYKRDWFKTCNTVVMVLTDNKIAWTRKDDAKNHADIDCSIVATYFMLAAKNEGIDTCWIGNFEVELAKQLFNFREGKEILALFATGYSKENKESEKNRKDVDEIVKYI